MLALVPPMPTVGPHAQPPIDDDALMTLAAAGRTSAYVVLVERYERRLRGFCRLLVRDEAQAYDIAQEVFLKIWKRRERYQPRGRFKEFLFAVARNECRSFSRKRAVLELFGLARLPEPCESSWPLPDETPNEVRLQLVEAALTRVPEKFRIPLTLRFVEGLSYAEIARVIGRTESAARSRVFYGLKALSALMPAEMS
jgi:RNA polymerase sigma-70 factor, ECF subfamily